MTKRTLNIDDDSNQTNKKARLCLDISPSAQRIIDHLDMRTRTSSGDFSSTEMAKWALELDQLLDDDIDLNLIEQHSAGFIRDNDCEKLRLLVEKLTSKEMLIIERSSPGTWCSIVNRYHEIDYVSGLNHLAHCVEGINNELFFEIEKCSPGLTESCIKVNDQGGFLSEELVHAVVQKYQKASASRLKETCKDHALLFELLALIYRLDSRGFVVYDEALTIKKSASFGLKERLSGSIILRIAEIRDEFADAYHKNSKLIQALVWSAILCGQQHMDAVVGWIGSLSGEDIVRLAHLGRFNIIQHMQVLADLGFPQFSQALLPRLHQIDALDAVLIHGALILNINPQEEAQAYLYTGVNGDQVEIEGEVVLSGPVTAAARLIAQILQDKISTLTLDDDFFAHPNCGVILDFLFEDVQERRPSLWWSSILDQLNNFSIQQWMRIFSSERERGSGSILVRLTEMAFLGETTVLEILGPQLLMLDQQFPNFLQGMVGDKTQLSIITQALLRNSQNDRFKLVWDYWMPVCHQSIMRKLQLSGDIDSCDATCVAILAIYEVVESKTVSIQYAQQLAWILKIDPHIDSQHRWKLFSSQTDPINGIENLYSDRAKRTEVRQKLLMLQAQAGLIAQWIEIWKILDRRSNLSVEHRLDSIDTSFDNMSQFCEIYRQLTHVAQLLPVLYDKCCYQDYLNHEQKVFLGSINISDLICAQLKRLCIIMNPLHCRRQPSQGDHIGVAVDEIDYKSLLDMNWESFKTLVMRRSDQLVETPRRKI